ncbi:MAG TPA: hypothetical protein VL284_03600 [Thermoanaerobaculia bacterium]|nr:hypothetical protein [Thermoanaerobaculia bacterium]
MRNAERAARSHAAGDGALDHVKSFYAKNFGARRAAIYVVGRFDDAPVERQIRNDFSSSRRRCAAELS